MQEQESLLNLEQYKQKKQRMAEEHIKDLYKKAYEYALKETNIREKVRAKMIFSKRFLLHDETQMVEEVEKLFQEWFLFDYKTIKGQTLFFQFLQSHPLHESVKLLGAIVLTAAWEPIIIRKIGNQNEEVTFTCQNVIQDEEVSVKTNLNCEEKGIYEGGIYFVRKVPLVTHQWILGPVFPVKSEGILSDVKHHYGQMNQKTGVLWRTYLKEEAPNFIIRSLS
ncbi:hypothetical protein F0342_17220 [Bacillus sp. CH30_1T]|uniref:hypothetical protein n=1 Tax=Bacillus sp. CH30_1T TaxID=2604836 RepID=UPI0011EE4D17|nr:hypothetical protein [Bacillus sp. CH30_1T]KAA0562167.1 hypothetical protein F0342_17220 [Bacillus sp. CH30_1T]